MNLFGSVHKIISLERSSGFRPFFIFLGIVTPTCLTLAFFFKENKFVLTFSLVSLGISWFLFLLTYCIKAFSHPSFCRSEKHLETMKRLALSDNTMTSSYILPNPEEQTEVKKELEDKSKRDT